MIFSLFWCNNKFGIVSCFIVVDWWFMIFSRFCCDRNCDKLVQNQRTKYVETPLEFSIWRNPEIDILFGKRTRAIVPCTKFYVWLHRKRNPAIRNIYVFYILIHFRRLILVIFIYYHESFLSFRLSHVFYEFHRKIKIRNETTRKHAELANLPARLLRSFSIALDFADSNWA